MECGLATCAEVERPVGVKRPALHRMMRSGEFPLPLKIGPRAVRWLASEIETWLANCPRATGEAA